MAALVLDVPPAASVMPIWHPHTSRGLCRRSGSRCPWGMDRPWFSPAMSASLPVDFFADYAAAAARKLAEWGHAVPSRAAPHEIVTIFINLERRRIDPRPRTVHIAAGLVVPADVQSGFELVKKVAETGGDLNLHLSSTVKTDADYDDSLLNDWGMHHLHLGEKVMATGKSTGLMQRTKELLFALVRPDSIYFVAIGEHGDWTRKRLLETANTNWPQLFEGRRVAGMRTAQVLTEEDHLKLRKHGILTPTAIGGALMYSPGGGYSTTGRSTEVTVTVDTIAREARHYEGRFQSMVPQILVEAAKRGVAMAELGFHYKGAQDGMVIVEDERAKIVVHIPIAPKRRS